MPTTTGPTARGGQAPPSEAQTIDRLRQRRTELARTLVELDADIAELALAVSSRTASVRTSTLLTAEEVAAELAVGRTTIYALLATGEIRSVAIGRLRRIPRAAVAEYLDRLAS